MRYDIYHCASTQTLKVVEYLRDEIGIRAWVPIAVIKRRLPRSKKRVTVQRAAIPGFVFIPQYDARLYSLDRPLWAAMRPLWTPTGGQATCSPAELLQMQEFLNREANPELPFPMAAPEIEIELAPRLATGSLVTIFTGPFAGYAGLLMSEDDEGTATVDLKGSLGELKISACLLKPF